MKSVLISIKPKWCELIASGKKTIEVRKTRPAIEKVGDKFKCYIYCTKPKQKVSLGNGGLYCYEDDLAILNRQGMPKIGNLWGALCEEEHLINGKVIGEFVCDDIDKISHVGTRNNDIHLRIVDENLYYKELDYEYVNNKCCISIRDLEEYSNGGALFGWHISELVIYDKPKELNEFHKPCANIENCLNKAFREAGRSLNKCFDCGCEIKRPPQSWLYCESEVDNE